MDKMELMRKKIEALNEAARAYYAEDREIMPNIEYDRLYDELSALEKETGVTLSGSPTQSVGCEVLNELPKERHEARLLSLDKTKDPEALKDFLKGREGLLAWKLDGLTIVLTYIDGKLQKAVTRGNGETGEVITSNARVFKNIPLAISFKGQLVLRGEAVIKYSDFEKINAGLTDGEAKYKNPRNLSSGSVRQLSSEVTAGRNIRFYAFSLAKAGGLEDGFASKKEQMEWLKKEGFEVVDYKLVDRGNVEEAIKWFAGNAAKSDLPTDGLVLSFDDIEYGKSLGSTAKFPKDAIAFKWKDELAQTTLEKIEWSASRTGLINPIAVFAPVELEGTTVSRASVHNLSVMKELMLGTGDTITVYKANMIIPQIAQNLTRSGNMPIPAHCPVCGGRTEIKSENGVETLICTNDECLAKHVKSFTHFTSRDAMNIEGLSEATLEKFIAAGIIKELPDLFRMNERREEIVQLEGFGEKSFGNLIKAVDAGRKTTPSRLLYALGIPGIGVANAKNICKACGQDWERVQNISKEELQNIYGVGEIMAESYSAFFNSDKVRESVKKIIAEIEFEKEDSQGQSALFSEKAFVITGSLVHFANRDELVSLIEKNGGKTNSSVTSKTDYLINNDALSNSSKNKKAKELGVTVITEDAFLEMIKGEKHDA